MQKCLESHSSSGTIAYGRGKAPEGIVSYKIGNYFDTIVHLAEARIADAQGYGSKNSTRTFIKFIRAYDPDIIQLHNIHGYYLNNKLLFNYLAESSKPIVWTIHDMWPVTGHCSFSRDCKKWLTHCEHCSQIWQYPTSYTDFSSRNFTVKKDLFTKPQNMTLVSPSKWIMDIVNQSYLKKYHNILINNGIDLQIYRPLPNREQLRQKYNAKKILLSVSSVFDERKGLKYLYKIAEKLDAGWQLFIVGLNDSQLKRLKSSGHKNVRGFKRIDDMEELTELYNIADVFCNTSIDDNYPTVNLESLACGTPVVSFNTGGISEQIFDGGGFTVPFCNLEDYTEKINKAAELSREYCSDTAAKLFDKQITYNKYFSLYKNLLYKRVNNT
jgi:glycosyltransferase involved in cell wall biosynthesis